MNFAIRRFFSEVLLALTEAEYRSLWIDVGSSESASEEQILRHCKLKKKTKRQRRPPWGFHHLDSGERWDCFELLTVFLTG